MTRRGTFLFSILDRATEWLSDPVLPVIAVIVLLLGLWATASYLTDGNNQREPITIGIAP